ncbi:MAG: helix-hairpin-helix domain-containing protein [Anaerolineales bacterium]|nr:helix-hairpin-helix domain-containing protein [Anaerolineales bacterium]
MNDWWKVAFGVVCGLLGGGTILLVCSPPRGQAIALSPPPSPAPIAVHVAGAVANPGVFSLEAGSRVRDAIEAAGGLLPEADTQALNLAAFSQDGERLVIPTLPPPTPFALPSRLSMATPAQSGSTPASVPGRGNLININTATQAELESLPYIGPALAQRIIEYREANGPFESIEEIIEVYGIGQSTFEKIKDLITVEAPF